MKNNSTAIQIISTIISKFIFLLGTFVISALLSRLLGPENKGVVTAIFVIPLLLVSFVDLGVRQATAFFIGKGIYKTEDIVSSVGFLWFFSSTLAVTLTGGYYYFSMSDKFGWAPLLLALLTIPLNLIVKYTSGVMQGKQKIGSINLSGLIGVIVNFGAVVLLVWILNLGIIGATLVNVLYILASAIYSIFILKRISKINIRYIHPIPIKLFTKGISYAAALFILQLNYRIDVIFLEKLSTVKAVGLYSVGVSMAELIWQLPAALSVVLFSKSANSKSDQEASRRAVRLLRMTIPLLLLLGAVIGILAHPIINILYGEAFAGSAEALQLLLPGIILMTIVKILQPDLAGRGYPLYAFWVYIGPLVINIGLNLLLIPRYGIIGAAITSSISYTCGALIFSYVYGKKENITMRNMLIVTKEDIQLIYETFMKKSGKMKDNLKLQGGVE
ncbi:oligosaccharide flippase family protein [Paenibacillus lycopersici]|uniref:Oligosaccharide flippase family protein n=1 Tax=Paenibacillus lycopersici TaxID=2704462 RepID=A0A6C0FV61_9BACL|nr:polysaccharide biosynthesis C-terminal domain-containing protein [Paenibacillus lycopersici]QHT59922.1 oligosaccharide flippase family protein [Paenibacillus lycopersici]